MVFIEPLQLETWIFNVFSGNSLIFLSLSLLAIIGLAGYFKMSSMVLFYMIGMFFILFNGWLEPSIYFLILSVGGLFLAVVIGRVVSK